MKRFLGIFLLAGLSCFLVACSYSLGTGKKPFSSIYIAPVKNKALAPQIQALLSKQIAQALIADGTYTVTHKGLADVILETEVTKYKQLVASTQENDSVLASTFDIELAAVFSVYDQREKDYLVEKQKADASIHIIADNSMQGSEYQSASELTRDLANKIKNYLISFW